MTDVIIPAWDEAETIVPILSAIRACELIGNIFVVIDPETTDNTAEVSGAVEGVTRITSKEHGKGQCVNIALDQVESPRVMFCDADITGLTTEHVYRLNFPWDHRRMVIGVPEFPKLDEVPGNFWPGIMFAWPWVSGIRAMPRMLAMSAFPLHGYMMEAQLNRVAERWPCQSRFERLDGCVSPLNLSETRRADLQHDRQWGIDHGIIPK